MQLETFAKSTRLERQGKPLNDYFTVSDYSVKDDDTLHLKGCLLAGADNITITIVTVSGTRRTAVIPFDAKVESLKNYIDENFSMNSECYNLSGKGEVLEDKKTLEQYAITNKNTVHCIPNEKFVELDIRVMNGGKYTIVISQYATVETLMEKLFIKSGIKVEHQKLTYGGQVISEKEKKKTTLKENEIDILCDVPTINCVRTVPGG